MTYNNISSSPVSLAMKNKLSRATNAYRSGDLASAEHLFKMLLEENFPHPLVFTILATIFAKTDRFDDAKHVALSGLKGFPETFDLLVLLGNIYRVERNFSESVKYYKKALSITPNAAAVHFNLSLSLAPLGLYEESEFFCKKAISITPALIQARIHLGSLLFQQNKFDEAKTTFLTVLETDNGYIPAMYSLANIYKSEGSLEKAKDYYQRIVLIAPEYTQAHFSYASIHKYSSLADPHIAIMEKQFQKTSLHNDQQIQISFALAKAHEDCKSFERAIFFLNQGNKLRFERFSYDINSDRLFIESIIKSFNNDILSKIPTSQNNTIKPIFIVGMPRSGTSLVEKIISTHTDVYGAGELENLFRLGTSTFLTESTDYLFNDIDKISRSIFDKIGESYIQDINKLSSNSNRVTDKLPFNMLMIGLIKLVFPKAKIIHCTRDPIDNCFAIYKKNFATDNYRFGYNLTTLGQFHKLYQKLMVHWHDTFPGDIYDVAYESLVENPEKEIIALINACDLEWQEDCLAFNKSKSVVKTASAYQVRQPIYKSSVALWKNFEPYIDELLNALK
jgi:tetratricopeptide (TPR) repeat protein